MRLLATFQFFILSLAAPNIQAMACDSQNQEINQGVMSVQDLSSISHFDSRVWNSFSDFNAGCTGTVVYVFLNNSEAPFELGQIHGDGSNLLEIKSVCPEVLSPFQSCQVRFNFTPQQSGITSTTATFSGPQLNKAPFTFYVEIP